VRLAAIDGGRSPSLTGAQRDPVPPFLTGDGGRAARPLVHDSAAYDHLAATLGLSPEALEAELAERSAFLAMLAERGICDPAPVAAAVADYPSLPEGANA
jgi:hypothetical protein